jgi:phosphatidylglycerol:prolipoprotein diacylglycerol transferase
VDPSLLAYDTGVEGVGTLSLPSYFTMVAVGFALAIFLAWRWAGRNGLGRDSVLDLGLYMVIFGVIGARLLHVIADGQLSNYINWCFDPGAVVWEITQLECRAPAYGGEWDSAENVCRPRDPGSRPGWERCTLWLQFWQGGLAYYGGFIFASLYGIYFIRREGLPLARVLDLSGWAIPFGLGWGRIGCFLNGCCYGAVVDHAGEPPWWAVSFPRWSPAWLDQLRQELVEPVSRASLHVHATQLYEAAAAFVIAAGAYAYVEPRKRFNGEVFLTSCVL